MLRHEWEYDQCAGTIRHEFDRVMVWDAEGDNTAVLEAAEKLLESVL